MIHSLVTKNIRKLRLAPNRGGFTLIEMILAIGLAALLLVIVYSTFFSIYKTIDAASEDQEVLETGRILLQLLQKDIRGTVAGTYPFVAKKGEIDNQPAADLEFVTTAQVSTNPLKLTRVGYGIVTSPKGDKLFVRRISKNLNAEPGSADAVYELTPSVTAFELSFYNGTGWVDEWDSKTSGSLPKEVKIKFSLADNKGKARTFEAGETFLTSPLPPSAGGSSAQTNPAGSTSTQGSGAQATPQGSLPAPSK